MKIVEEELLLMCTEGSKRLGRWIWRVGCHLHRDGGQQKRPLSDGLTA